MYERPGEGRFIQSTVGPKRDGWDLEVRGEWSDDGAYENSTSENIPAFAAGDQDQS